MKNRKLWLVGLCIPCVAFLLWWTSPTIKPFGTIKVYDRNQRLLYESSQAVGSKQPIAFTDLPQSFVNAVVATEDDTFWTNPGIDLTAIGRSAWLNIRRQEIVSGASTITQQVARAAVIAPNSRPSRSLLRKIREVLIALRLTSLYSKEDIFQLYSNTVYFGNQTYGVQAASRLYFNKDVSALSLAESAFLAGLLASPEARNPYTNWERSKKAQQQVLSSMQRRGMITQDEQHTADAETLTILPPRTTAEAPHFVHEVLKFVDGLELNTQQGLAITTTLDFHTYRLSEATARQWVEKLAAAHDLSNAAVVVLDNKTGDVLSMMGGVDFMDATNSGEVNMTTALRQPGSALKPITYAAAFTHGMTPATLLYDVQQIFPTKTGEGFSPNNYDGQYHGPVLARTALASSLNIPAVETLSRIGVPELIRVSRDMGISSFTEPDRYDLALTLGGGEVQLLELTNAYATLARGGKHLPARLVQRITTDAGATVYEEAIPDATQTLGEQGEAIAYLVTDILSDAKARLPGFGERSPLTLSVSAAVKTGTTTDWHDNWTIGYTPAYTVGVWVGNNDNRPMTKISGVVGAAPIWQQFFEEFLKDKKTEEFIRPSTIAEQEICAETGLLPTSTCGSIRHELFAAGTQPTEAGSFKVAVNIDTRNGLRAGDGCPAQYTSEKILWEYPPQLYSWAQSEGLPLAPTAWSPLCPNTDDVARVHSTSLKQGEPVVITSPKQRAVFESAPQLLTNQSLVFEAQVSPQVKKLEWYVDDAPVATSTRFPFSASWQLEIGNHTVHARATLADTSTVITPPVAFTVVAYKDYTSY